MGGGMSRVAGGGETGMLRAAGTLQGCAGRTGSIGVSLAGLAGLLLLLAALVRLLLVLCHELQKLSLQIEWSNDQLPAGRYWCCH